MKGFLRIPLFLGLAVGGLLAPAVATSAPPAGPAEQDARSERSDNYCLGGIEDRKIIVDESQVTDPFRQTTRLGCEVDGGDPQTMPDLPAPSPIRTVLARAVPLAGARRASDADAEKALDERAGGQRGVGAGPSAPELRPGPRSHQYCRST